MVLTLVTPLPPQRWRLLHIEPLRYIRNSLTAATWTQLERSLLQFGMVLPILEPSILLSALWSGTRQVCCPRKRKDLG